MTLPAPIFWSLAALSLLGAAGCEPRAGRQPVQERVLLHTGFEELAGWLPEPGAGPTTERAHAGRYAVRVDPQHPYSVTYRARLGQLSPRHRPRRLTLSAWVWVPGPEGDARLVTVLSAANDPEHPFFNKSVFLSDGGPYGKWKKVSRRLDLPDNVNSDSRLAIYLWNGNSTVPVFADDLQLTELW